MRPPFFFINSSTVYKYSHTKCSQKNPLMSRKHSFFYLSFSSVYFLHCVLYCRNLPNIQTYPVKTEATGSSRHPRHLVHGIESPPDIFIALPLSRSSHDPSGLNCSSDSQVQDEGRKAKKSQCEAGALDISALGAGPEVRNRTVLHGSASSFSVGGVDGQIWIKQFLFYWTDNPQCLSFKKPGNALSLPGALTTTRIICTDNLTKIGPQILQG